jgi:hypothetical protein
VAIAPAVFDRMEKNFQTGYTPDDMTTARAMVGKADFPAMLRDTQAAIDAVKSVGKVGITGFCMGGTITFLASTQLSGRRERLALDVVRAVRQVQVVRFRRAPREDGDVVVRVADGRKGLLGEDPGAIGRHFGKI